MLQGVYIEFIEKELTKKLNQNIRILETKRVSGGCINSAAWVNTNAGTYFLKWNTCNERVSMLEAEAKGLKLLDSANVLKIPKVLFVSRFNSDEFICMEYIDKGSQNKNFWLEFGSLLARLHKYDAREFGLPYNNFIGSLPQINRPAASWAEFFVSDRLEPMIKMARLSSINNNKFEKLFHKIGSIFPIEPPCLLHGDLWNGNYMVNKDGRATIFDPAVYFGHREMDIAMTRLFGGFENEFYIGYNSEWPLNDGWEDRVDICNLYPLLVHVNLFGNSYLGQVESILDRFISL